MNQHPTSRIHSIDLLRGIAAIAVSWFHFTSGSTFLGEGWLRESGAYGWLGVEAFFVISGFVIPYSLYHSGYRFPRDAGRFLVKRVVRLDPPYLTAILLAVALSFISAQVPGFRGEPPHYTWPQLLSHLGYLNALVELPWVIPVLWTLAIEFQFYLCMSACFPLLTQRRNGSRLGIVLVLLALPFLIPAEALLFKYFGLFVLGISTFQRSVGLLSGAGFWAQYGLAVGVSYAALGAPAAVVGAITGLLIPVERFPVPRLLAAAGAISYSLYLLHVPIGGRVVNLGARFASGTWTTLAVLLAALAATLGASYLLFRFVELPCRRISSAIRFGAPSVPAPTTVPATTPLDPEFGHMTGGELRRGHPIRDTRA